tara:strand:+ start:401 stop:1165 length:765 start_codon:yes stop_codon:yes gene_type:complete
MPWSFIVPAAASLFGASQQADATQNAANLTGAATDRATQLQNAQNERTYADQAPYRQLGFNALAEMQRTAKDLPGAFSFSGDAMYNDPGYGFRLSQGKRALEHELGARGGAVTGRSLQAMQDYAQNSASNEFGNAYNRALTSYNSDISNKNQLYNRQAAMAGIGQSATNFGNAAGANNANTIGNALINQSVNAANAGMIGANAYGNAFSSIGSAYGKNPVDFRKIFNYGNTGVNGGAAGNPLAIGEYADSGYWT